MSARQLNDLLDKLTAGSITSGERAALIEELRGMEQDPDCPPAERMAAMLMRAALEVRSISVVIFDTGRK